jgi:phosphoglycolate phosphatase-like HAD superfamily hydrolase
LAAKLGALVLDFDGVLVESEGLKTDVFREVFARFPEHLEAMMAFHAAQPSAPRHTKFAELARRLGRPDDARLLQSLAEDFSRRALSRTAVCPEVPGAADFLREFAPRLPLFLASLTPEADLLEIVRRRGWAAFFQDVFGFPPRPKTEAIARAVAASGGRREAVALIGDAPSDLAAAQETGIDFIGRDSGLAFPDPRPWLYPDMQAIAVLLRERL